MGNVNGYIAEGRRALQLKPVGHNPAHSAPQTPWWKHFTERLFGDSPTTEHTHTMPHYIAEGALQQTLDEAKLERAHEDPQIVNATNRASTVESQLSRGFLDAAHRHGRMDSDRESSAQPALLDKAADAGADQVRRANIHPAASYESILKARENRRQISRRLSLNSPRTMATHVTTDLKPIIQATMHAKSLPPVNTIQHFHVGRPLPTQSMATHLIGGSSVQKIAASTTDFNRTSLLYPAMYRTDEQAHRGLF